MALEPEVIHWQDLISLSQTNHGSMFVPIILGSDKTTVSVATGQNDFYPLYLSIGNVHNSVRRAHRNAIVVLSFLPIPKGERLPPTTGRVAVSQSFTISGQRARPRRVISCVSSQDFPQCCIWNPRTVETGNVRACDPSLPRRSLSTSDLWVGTLHCRLPGTSSCNLC